MMSNDLVVYNRHGEKEIWNFEKVQNRILNIINMEPKLDKLVPSIIIQQTIAGMKNEMTTEQIDMYTARMANNLSTESYQYYTLASRIVVSSLHKETLDTFFEKVKLLYFHRKEYPTADGIVLGASLISEKFYNFVEKNAERLDAIVDYSRDYKIEYLGMGTLMSSYLLCRVDSAGKKRIVERPQDMFLRTSIAIYLKEDGTADLGEIEKHYLALSNHKFMHASPTLYNAGTPLGQLSSCFLLGSEDSIEGIMKTQADCCYIAKRAGGIGMHNSWRALGSYIAGTNGITNGKLPFFKGFSSYSEAVDQGGGKRKGSMAVYEMIHDADIQLFLNMRKIIDESEGSEPGKKKNFTLFPALWVSDLFVKRIKEDGMFSLFSYDQCPKLWNTWGAEYEKLYLEYEKRGLYRSQIKAKKLMKDVIATQYQSGLPYVLFADNANRFSNQQNIGTIRSSNLCTEIIIYSDEKEYGTCNLASICLPLLVKDKKGGEKLFPEEPYFDFTELREVTERLVVAVNNVIDNTNYPVEESRISNLKHRPIGIGVQGLADVFFKFGVEYDSPDARKLNKAIFETIYYAALKASCKLAKEQGAYETFPGSPLSKGIFRWELSGLKREDMVTNYEWDALRFSIKKNGVRNSLLIALMPTASTSHITGNSECFSPVEAYVEAKGKTSGNYLCTNKYLFHDLERAGVEDIPLIMDEIAKSNGSVQKIEGIPEKIKKIYKTAYEINPFHLVEMASDRQHFVDQSQSMNLFVPDVKSTIVFDNNGKQLTTQFSVLARLFLYSWEKKLITANYYIKQLPVTQAMKTTNIGRHRRKLEKKKEVYDENHIDFSDITDDTCFSCSA